MGERLSETIALETARREGTRKRKGERDTEFIKRIVRTYMRLRDERVSQEHLTRVAREYAHQRRVGTLRGARG